MSKKWQKNSPRPKKPRMNARLRRAWKREFAKYSWVAIHKNFTFSIPATLPKDQWIDLEDFIMRPINESISKEFAKMETTIIQCQTTEIETSAGGT